MLVSTIIPAFNAAEFIGETIDSALRQTHRPHEVIVVDDGSDDDTAQVVESFGDHVRLYQQSNSGPGAARNLAVSKASGTWIAFLDSDDLWMPDKLEKQLATVDANDGLVYTDRLNFGQIGSLSERKSDGGVLVEGDIFKNLLETGNCVTLSSVMMPRDFFLSIGGFNERKELGGVADWELWLRAAARRPVRLCKEPLVKYRCHADGMSKNVRAMFTGQEAVLDLIFEGQPAVDRQSLERLARSSSAATSAFFAQNSRQFWLASRLYCRSLRYRPFNIAAYKGILKCFLRRQ